MVIKSFFSSRILALLSKCERNYLNILVGHCHLQLISIEFIWAPNCRRRTLFVSVVSVLVISRTCPVSKSRWGRPTFCPSDVSRAQQSMFAIYKSCIKGSCGRKCLVLVPWFTVFAESGIVVKSKVGYGLHATKLLKRLFLLSSGCYIYFFEIWVFASITHH